MSRTRIVWTHVEMQAVAARTLQIRHSGEINNVVLACIAAQRELLTEDRWRIAAPGKETNLGPVFRDACVGLALKSQAQLTAAIRLHKPDWVPPAPAPVVAEKPNADAELPEVKEEPAPAPVVEPVAAAEPEQTPEPAPAYVRPAEPAKTNGIGALLEGALVQAMAPVIDTFMEQMRVEVRSAFENVQRHYAEQMEDRLRHMLHSELAGLTPGARMQTPAVRHPRHDPSPPMTVAPSTAPKYRIIIFHMLDSQVAIIKDAMRQQLDMHRVQLLGADTKADLMRKHTKDSYVIYIPKFSNHLPPNYERDYVRKVLFAKGTTGVQERIHEILQGKHD